MRIFMFGSENGVFRSAHWAREKTTGAEARRISTPNAALKGRSSTPNAALEGRSSTALVALIGRGSADSMEHPV